MKTKKYQIFLSSTYSDLIDERESIIKAVLEMYHIPIGMEMFSAEDEDQWEIIRRTIEVSDYYILVLGLRYGSKTSDGISFTQKEYEFALEQKIPVLAFIMDEMVSLPKDRRDNNLTEITAFREVVLKNSKMAQFWKTKDELIKNVSISLMKQIMQKPGVGWMRGDNVDAEEALSNELTILSKENRELREKIAELESKILRKIPKIKVSIDPLNIDEGFNRYEKVLMPNIIILEDVDLHLQEYITKEDIDRYNSSLPTQSDLDQYNMECENIYKIKTYAKPFSIQVENIGSAKANNIFVDIKFPDEILVYENEKEFMDPKNPLPLSPVIIAQRKYDIKITEKQKQISAYSMLSRNFGLGEIIHGESIPAFGMNRLKIPKIPTINQNWWTSLKDSSLTIKINTLIHTRYRQLEDEYMIAPLMKGKHIVEVSIICEEYDAIETQHIEIEI